MPSFLQQIHQYRTLLVTTGVVVLTHLLTSPVFAQVEDWSEDNGEVYVDEYGNQVATIKGIEALVANVLAVFTTIIGLASFVMLIVGAFMYLTSGGNSKGTEAGKQSITYAIIGIVVSLMAFFILQLIANFTGVDAILDFNLGIE